MKVFFGILSSNHRSSNCTFQRRDKFKLNAKDVANDVNMKTFFGTLIKYQSEDASLYFLSLKHSWELLQNKKRRPLLYPQARNSWTKTCMKYFRTIDVLISKFNGLTLQ